MLNVNWCDHYIKRMFTGTLLGDPGVFHLCYNKLIYWMYAVNVRLLHYNLNVRYMERFWSMFRWQPNTMVDYVFLSSGSLVLEQQLFSFQPGDLKLIETLPICGVDCRNFLIRYPFLIFYHDRGVTAVFRKVKYDLFSLECNKFLNSVIPKF